MNHKELKGLRELHTSRTRGYISRKNPDGIVTPYKGRFGEGFKLLTPAWDTTQFCFLTYFVK